LEDLVHSLQREKEDSLKKLKEGQNQLDCLKKKFKLSENHANETQQRLQLQEKRSASLGKENIKLVGDLNSSEQKVFRSEIKVNSLEACVFKLEKKLQDAYNMRELE